jgi:hypothetical protein
MLTAQTLGDALNTLDTDALRAEEMAAFYVKRPRLKTAQLIYELLHTDARKKFLFIGHRGGGKSTELVHVAAELTDKFNVVSIPVYSVFQSGELTHEELIFAIYSRLAAVAVAKDWMKGGIIPKVREAFLDRAIGSVQRWLFGPTGSGPSAASTDTSLSAELGGWGVKLEQKIALDGKVREKLAGKAGEFLGLIDEFLAEIQGATGRHTLLIVEDLDKFDIASTEKLFFDHSQTLLRPQARIIYTFPVAMRFSDRFPIVEQSFKAYYLPNIATRHRDGKEDAEGRSLLHEILTRRAAEALFEPGVLDYMVGHGGVVRDLIKLAQNAVNTAAAEGRTAVTLADAQEAFSDAMRTRQSILRPGDYPLLEQFDGKPVANTPDIQRLLFNGSLLEYQNTTGDWCAPSPDAKALLTSPERPALPQP